MCTILRSITYVEAGSSDLTENPTLRDPPLEWSVLPRFHAPDARAGEPEALLPEEEAHHATHVMRLTAGDELAVFDGRGREWRARVLSASRAGVRVALLEGIEPAAEPRTRLTLAQAVLKGDRMDAVIRDATMMGVARIAPLVTARTVARASAAANERARARWQRVALASAKQCRRATLPEIAPPAPLEAFLEGVPADAPRIVLAEPAAGLRSSTPSAAEAPGSAVLAVGPEGGWSRVDLERFAAARFTALTLGALTLRADVAALVAISVLRAGWGDL
jgi:16S rRNA (uracil1498-N3)-methyltransferase